MLYLKNLCKGYIDGGVFNPVLQGAELSLDRGAQLALMGESGSGKSTLLNMIAGLDTCDSGEIICSDFPMHDAPDRQKNAFRRNNIGLIFHSLTYSLH